MSIFFFVTVFLSMCGAFPTNDDDKFLAHVKEVYEQKKDGFSVCLFDGLLGLCNLRQEICSAKKKRCYSGMFESDYTEDQKDEYCEDVLAKKKVIDIEGIEDLCIYRIGYRASVRSSCKNCTDVAESSSYNNTKPKFAASSSEKSQLAYITGKEFCPFGGSSFCDRDREVCNPESWLCQQVLPNISAKSKIQYCEKVINSKDDSVKGLRDVCIYYIGTQRIDQDSNDEGNSNAGKDIGLDVGLPICLTVLGVACVIGAYIARKRYRSWRKRRQRQVSDDRNNPRESIGDENRQDPQEDSSAANIVRRIEGDPESIGMLSGKPTEDDKDRKEKKKGKGRKDYE